MINKIILPIQQVKTQSTGKKMKKTQSTGKKMKKTPSNNKTMKKKSGGTNGGNWWPFSNTSTNNSQSVYDKYIEKYKKQINDLQNAIKLLQDKITKMETAKEAEIKIKNEKDKLEKLTAERNEAVKSGTSSGWFSGFFK